MARTTRLVRLAALGAALALPMAAGAQGTQPVAGATNAQDFPAAVRALAPQLVNFAGSTANFQNLVNGLARGTPVTLVGVTPDGFQQTATFTPSTALDATRIAQALEQARQRLISSGVATPSPEQIGLALTGTPASPATGLQVQVSPATPQASVGSGTPATAVQVPGTTSASPVVSNTSNTPLPAHTSDSPFLGNTSDSPLPPTAVPSAGSSSGVVSPGAVNNTSPAARMQNRR